LQQALAAKHPPELVEANVKKITAGAVSEYLKAFYSAMQAGQVAASVPSVAPIADQMLADSGFTPQGGVDPDIPVPVAPDPLLSQGDIYDPRTGVGFMPGGQDRANTSPMLPAPPAGPAEGLGQGVETARADGVRQ
jgi:hypothetical protein